MTIAARLVGVHHVSLPVTDAGRSSDWYERVFGFTRVLITEEEDRVSMVVLEHPARIVLHLHQVSEEHVAGWRRANAGMAAVGFAVASQQDLADWESRLTELGVHHSGPRPAHLGLSLDLLDPDGLGIQLHTPDDLSGDDG